MQTFVSRLRLACVCFFVIAAWPAGAQRDAPISAEARFEEAEEAMRQHRWQQADQLLTNLLHAHPDHHESYLARAQTRQRLNRTAEALTDYSIYLEFRPDQAEALFARGTLLYQLQRFDQAQHDFTRALNAPASPTTSVFFRQAAFANETDHIFTSASTPKAEIFHFLALISAEKKQFALAQTYLDSALRYHPTDLNLLVTRGWLTERGGDDMGAEMIYRDVLKRDAQHPLAKHNLSVLLRKKGEQVSDSLEQNESLPYPWAEKGYASLQAGRWREAIVWYSRAIKLDSTTVDYYLNRGLAYEKVDDFVRSYRDYTHAIALQPNFEKAWLNRANLLVKVNRHADAIDDYTVATMHAPTYAAAYYNRALAYLTLRKFTEACADLQQAAALGINVKPSLMQSCNR
jgi:tetratricopeptide (TPR) repeat protein